MAITLDLNLRNPASNQQVLDKLLGQLSDLGQQAGQDFSAGFDQPWGRFVEQARLSGADLAKSSAGSWRDSLDDTLRGSLSALMRGEFDTMADLWDSAWQSMLGSLDGLFSDLLGGLVDGLLGGVSQGLGGLLDGLGLKDLGSQVLGSVGDLLGLGGAAASLAPAAGSGLAGGAAAGAALALGPASLLGGVAVGLPLAAMGLDALLGSDSMTPEEAQDRIGRQMDFIATASQRLAEAAEQGRVAWSGLGVDIQDSLANIDRLQELAGLTDQQFAAWVDTFPPVQAALIQAGETANQCGQTIEQLVYQLQQEAGAGQDATLSLVDLEAGLQELVEGMPLGAEASAQLSEAITQLGEQVRDGGLDAQEMAQSLTTKFRDALVSAAAQGQLTKEEMRRLGEAIQAIPTYWRSEVHLDQYETLYKTEVIKSVGAGEATLHGGGWLNAKRYHGGAQVTALAHDEVPIIARRGEFVVRAESVTATTLPWLQGLNQTGRTGAATSVAGGAQLTINGPVLQVQGSLIASDEQKEALARELETRLLALTRSRFGTSRV